MKHIGFWLGLAGFFAILLWFDPVPDQPGVGRMAAVVFLMAVWWVSEALPLAATSLLPLVLFPVLGLLGTREIAPSYINSTIFLFLGGFLLALAMEKWNLHRRIALLVLVGTGRSPGTLVLGFMAAAAFLSMWISNTATAVMMLPMAMAVLDRLDETHGKEKVRPLGICLMLAIAYACSIGGLATLVGTPPNLVLRQIHHDLFPQAREISFGSWALVGIPLALAMLVITWWLLTKVIYRPAPGIRPDPQILRRELRELGPLGREEKIVLGVFAVTAFLWMGREDIAILGFVLPGWSGIFLPPGVGKFVDDGTVAIAMALLLFVWPASNGRGRILDEQIFSRVPWGIILLFGGGFALAKGFVDSGLSVFLADRLFSNLAGLDPLLMVLSICVFMTFFTEFTSNTASTQLVLPLLAAVAVAQNLPPLLLMIPATFSASMAFMLPVATPPNAIVFGSNRVRVAEMCRAGIFLNLIGMVLVTLAVYFLARPVFGF